MKQLTFEYILKAFDQKKIKVKKHGHFIQRNLKEVFESEQNFESILQERIPDYVKKYNFGEQFLTAADVQCSDCEALLAFRFIDETTLELIPFKIYKELKENPKLKIPTCPAKKIISQKKLVSRIEVPSGEIRFANYFQPKEFYTDPENEWGRPGICCIYGRQVLMSYLATKNVGYGQMGNMSIGVYYNSTEIIIADDMMEDSYQDIKKHSKNPNLKELKEFEKSLAYLKDNNFKLKDDITLSVWRWQCVDESIFKKNKMEVGGDDTFKIKVEPGIYEIEHYYDFNKGSDANFYSKITKIEDIK